MSVRLYVLRNRLTTGRTVKRNLLVEMLQIKFRHIEDFSPTRTFYQETGIGQRRYWDLFFGRKPITSKEYAAVAEYLGVTRPSLSRELAAMRAEGLLRMEGRSIRVPDAGALQDVYE